jgi:NAD(P)-dependent dehydrogenase (short-subunit alcohol dehydrogenase family)
MTKELSGSVAVVAGGTRGASRAIAVELGRAGATVYVTGRTSGTERSEVDRPETIEGTAKLVDEAGGTGIPVRVDHLEPDQVAALAERIDAEHGRIDVLAIGLWGGDTHMEWAKPVWEHSLDKSLRMLQLGVSSHVITAHHLMPLVIRKPGGLAINLTDGTPEYAAEYRTDMLMAYYLVKSTAHYFATALAAESKEYGTTAVALTPGWLRSEAMLEAFGVTEETWRDAITPERPHFCISESPTYTGRTVAALAADPDRARFSGQTLSSGQLARIYDITDVDGSQPDCWRYIAEVERPGKPADATGYR